VTSRSSLTAATGDEAHLTSLREVEVHLRVALLRLGPEPSAGDLRAAEHTMDQAERILSTLVDDPWERSVARQAREILSSHLLAAAACDGADAGNAVTAKVLRRGADSAGKLLAGQNYRLGVEATT
jgi:hypothetical protein